MYLSDVAASTIVFYFYSFLFQFRHGPKLLGSVCLCYKREITEFNDILAEWNEPIRTISDSVMPNFMTFFFVSAVTSFRITWSQHEYFSYSNQQMREKKSTNVAYQWAKDTKMERNFCLFSMSTVSLYFSVGTSIESNGAIKIKCVIYWAISLTIKNNMWNCGLNKRTMRKRVRNEKRNCAQSDK